MHLVLYLTTYLVELVAMPQTITSVKATTNGQLGELGFGRICCQLRRADRFVEFKGGGLKDK